MFQMTSVLNNSQVDECYQASKKSPFLKNLIEETGFDVTEMLTGQQPMLAAFTHSSEGKTKKMPVQLLRTPYEDLNIRTQFFYETLLSLFKEKKILKGKGKLITPLSAWENNSSFEKFIILSIKQKENMFLAVVNYAPHPSQCFVPFNAQSETTVFHDLLNPVTYRRERKELEKGLYLDMPPFTFHLFEVK